MMLVMMTLSWWQKVDDERYHPLRMEGEQEASDSESKIIEEKRIAEYLGR